MKRFIIALAIAALVSSTPVHARARVLSKGTVTFHAPIPCTMACSYNLDELSAACTAPSPEGSFADRVVKAPRGANILVFTGYPAVDWDMAVCAKSKTSNRGKLLAFEPPIYVDEAVTGCAVGCVTRIILKVVPGRQYVLRAFNFSDPLDLPARWEFLRV